MRYKTLGFMWLCKYSATHKFGITGQVSSTQSPTFHTAIRCMQDKND